MPADAPIACTLSPADLRQRLAVARALGAVALEGMEVRGSHAKLLFSGDRGPVENLVAAETRCCPFLTFELTDTPNGRLELDIRASEGGEPLLRSLVAAIVAGWEGRL